MAKRAGIIVPFAHWKRPRIIVFSIVVMAGQEGYVRDMMEGLGMGAFRCGPRPLPGGLEEHTVILIPNPDDRPIWRELYRITYRREAPETLAEVRGLVDGVAGLYAAPEPEPEAAPLVDESKQVEAKGKKRRRMFDFSGCYSDGPVEEAAVSLVDDDDTPLMRDTLFDLSAYDRPAESAVGL